MDTLSVSLMFFEDETNTIVVAYKDVIPYYRYRDDGVFCRISSILATKRNEPSILHKEWRLYY